MSYPDYTAVEARRADANAILFRSVGLSWLATVEARKAARLKQSLRKTAKKS